MALAIEVIFISIQSEEIITKNNLFCELLCLQYTNIFVRVLICDEKKEIKEGIIEDYFDSYQIQI